MKTELTDYERRVLEDLWFVYGSYGPEHTNSNHHWIQGFLERGEDNRDFYYPTDECKAAVGKLNIKYLVTLGDTQSTHILGKYDLMWCNSTKRPRKKISGSFLLRN